MNFFSLSLDCFTIITYDKYEFKDKPQQSFFFTVLFGDADKLKQFIFSAPWLVGSYLLHVVEAGVWSSVSPTVLLLCMLSYVSLRVFAMSVNQLADKRFDEKNPRTKNRLLCTGDVTVNQVMWVIGLSVVTFLISTMCMIYASNVSLILGWLSPHHW